MCDIAPQHLMRSHGEGAHIKTNDLRFASRQGLLSKKGSNSKRGAMLLRVRDLDTNLRTAAHILKRGQDRDFAVWAERQSRPGFG